MYDSPRPHRYIQPALVGAAAGTVVPRIRVAEDAHGGFVGEDALDAGRGLGNAIGDDDCVPGVADAAVDLSSHPMLLSSSFTRGRPTPSEPTLPADNKGLPIGASTGCRYHSRMRKDSRFEGGFTVGLTGVCRADLSAAAVEALKLLDEDINDAMRPSFEPFTVAEFLLGRTPPSRILKHRLATITELLATIGFSFAKLDFDAMRARVQYAVRLSDLHRLPWLTSLDDLDRFADAVLAIAPWRVSEHGTMWVFDRFVWEETKSDGLLTPEQRTLEMLDEIDRDRRRFERLRRIHIDGHPRNAGAREPIPEATRAFVFRRDGGRCQLCGSDKSLHFDHIIPAAKGGGNHPDNLQLLCEPCNLKKSDSI